MKQAFPTFFYGGYHFTPVKRLSNYDSDFLRVSKQLRSNWELGFTTYPHSSKFPWSYKDFYEAAGNCEVDLFRCEENKKIYFPCENELFLFLDRNGGLQQ